MWLAHPVQFWLVFLLSRKLWCCCHIYFCPSVRRVYENFAFSDYCCPLHCYIPNSHCRKKNNAKTNKLKKIKNKIKKPIVQNKMQKILPLSHFLSLTWTSALRVGSHCYWSSVGQSQEWQHVTCINRKWAQLHLTAAVRRPSKTEPNKTKTDRHTSFTFAHGLILITGGRMTLPKWW